MKDRQGDGRVFSQVEELGTVAVGPWEEPDDRASPLEKAPAGRELSEQPGETQSLSQRGSTLSTRKTFFISETSQSKKLKCALIVATCIIFCPGMTMHVLGLVSSFNFWSLSAMAWSSLLRPLYGTWSTRLFALLPCARDFDVWFCCFASYAATRLCRNDTFFGYIIKVSVYLSKTVILTFCSFQEETIFQLCFGAPH